MNRVKTKMVVAFLESKGWILEKKDFLSFIMIPPADFKPEPQARLYVPLPKFEGAKDYEFIIDIVLGSISELYEIDKKRLVTLFSESSEEMKAGIEMRNKILEFA